MVEKKKLTPFEQECIETAKEILGYKNGAEANVVAIIYKNPDVLYNSNLQLTDFHNNIWKVYFEIAYEIIKVEKKTTLDDITIGLYLEKHKKLKKKYEEYGEFKTIETAKEYVDISNFNSYVSEMRKWGVLLKLCKEGYSVKNKLSDFADMKADEIYNEYEVFLNHTFGNIDSDVKSYDLCDGIYDLIEKLDVGFAHGLPYHNMPMLTNEVGGQYRGSITLLGGISNAGKSSVARTTTIPSIIEKNEKVVIMINEDSLAKWQREMLVWVCNNVLNYNIQKHTVRDGKYEKEVKEKLYEAAKWLEQRTENHTITMIPFIQYQTSKAVQEIKKYCALGVKYFILDTFKMDAGEIGNNSWLQMQQAMVSIKDAVKAESNNVHILITFQLEKGSSVMRYYTQNNIGMAKNIVDVASTCIMIRDIYDDEYPDGKYPLKVYRLEGKNGKTKIEVPLSRDKNYQVFFIVKNQEGAANSYQIVAEHDKSRNLIKEIGITNISPNF